MRPRQDGSPTTSSQPLLVGDSARKPTLSWRALTRAVLTFLAVVNALAIWHNSESVPVSAAVASNNAEPMSPDRQAQLPPTVRFGHVPIPEVQRLADDERAFILRRFHANQSRALWDYCGKVRTRACITFTIESGRLYISKYYKGFFSRHTAMASLIRRAVESMGPLRDVTFTVYLGDGRRSFGGLPVLTFCRYQPSMEGVLVPDFSFFDWPEIRLAKGHSTEFNRLLELYAALPRDFYAKTNEIFWRGSNLARRDAMVSQIAAAHAAWNGSIGLNVEFTTWLKQSNSRGVVAVEITNNSASLLEFCAHRYLLHLDGHTYSSRIKYLLLCGSTVLAGTQMWHEWFYPLLPGHHVPLASGFAAALHWIDANTHTAETMAARAQALMLRVFAQKEVDYYIASVIDALAEAGFTYHRHGPGTPIADFVFT